MTPIDELAERPLADLAKEDVRRLAAEAWHDPVFFCKYFLSDLFSGRVPWLHRGILAILTRKTDFLKKYGEIDKIVSNFVYERNGETHYIFKEVGGRVELERNRFTLIMVPRGFSKTTLAGVGFGVYNIVFGEMPFAVYVSETATHAEMQLDNVKRQLETNQKLKFFFGDLKPGMQSEQRWRQNFFETTTGMAMAARGRGGQVRGLNHNGQRPKIILVDDVEDRESVATPEQRDKTRKWAYADLRPALPALDADATMVALGTLLHPEALMMTWACDPQWTVVKFGSYDRQGDLLWPENMDEAKLKAEEESAIASNTLPEFYMERHSVIRLDRDQDFKEKQFQYGSPPEGEPLFTTLYQDPAIGEKETSDFCTFTVVSMTTKGRIYVRKQIGKRGMSPREQINTLFDLHREFTPDRTGIESNAFQKALIHLVQEEMFRQKRYFEVTPVTNSKAKHERIKGILQPRFASKYVWFTGRFLALEGELLNFPLGAHDDHADGLAGAVSLLDDAAFLADDGEGGGEEMEELSKVIGGNWRHAV